MPHFSPSAAVSRPTVFLAIDGVVVAGGGGHESVLASPVGACIPAFMENRDTRIAFGMNMQGAIDMPRFSMETFPGCDVNLESRISQAVRDSLAELLPDRPVVQPVWR